uniref:Chromosome 6 C9orf152 homolog n=2 Tax=Xenopus tropicalis TaxID=8364 RepID=A0A803JVD4_XENTR
MPAQSLHLFLSHFISLQAVQVPESLMYLTSIFSNKEPADGTRKPSKMDISRLEEQYHCIKQKQKQQTHIIVFKAGKSELISGEPILNTVPVNEVIRKQKSFEEQMPVKDVMLEVLDKSYLKESDGSWHTHLNIHRMVQLDCQFGIQNGSGDKVKEMNFENKRPVFNRMVSCDTLCSNQKERRSLERNGRSSSVDSPHGSSYKCSLQHAIPASWASLKLSSPTDKLTYYPFPQKKNPRISETARKLGLYVTH